MPTNRFEDSRISEGTTQYGAGSVGKTAREDLPEQVKNEDFGKTEFPDSGEVRGSNKPSDTAPAEPYAATSTAGSRYRRVLSAGSLIGDRVHNSAGEHLGSIEQIMIDIETGRVAYAVLSFGGFLGIGDKLFAVPWRALRLDKAREEFVLDVDSKTLENAPGFDKGTWPDMADPAFGTQIHAHYEKAGSAPVYEQNVTDAGDYIGDNAQPNRSMEFEPWEGYRLPKS